MPICKKYIKKILVNEAWSFQEEEYVECIAFEKSV